jgi:hypothetical protein
MLIWAGNNIRPDLILLVYMNGIDPKEKIELIKAGITFPGVRVESYQIEPAWHRFGRIFGAGTHDGTNELRFPVTGFIDVDCKRPYDLPLCR